MNSIKQLHQLAQSAINRRDYVAAHGFCVQIIKQQADHADAYFLLGIINSEIGQFNKAIQLIEKAISCQPQYEYYAFLAKCYSLTGDMKSALSAVHQAPASAIEQGLTLDTLGVAVSRIGEHELALTYFEKVLSKEKKNPFYFYNYAVSSKFAGKFEQARAAFNRAIALKPDYHQAHFALADLGGINATNNHIDRLEALFTQQLSPEASLHLGHALAKEYEAVGDNQAAFKVLEQAKQIKLDQTEYTFAQDKRLFDAALPSSSDEKSTEYVAGCQSASPIFVLGMPRSGTTLVERIISCHSQVQSCGELQDFGIAVKELTKTPSQTVLDPETLAASANIDFPALGQRYIERTRPLVGAKSHFVDKLPFNFFYIDQILKALPNAKIVCLLRDPMDTCIGNYRQLFSINSPYYNYAYDLQTTGKFYKEFYTLVHKWNNKQLPNFTLLSYEDLVADPSTQIPKLIDFCGLEWQQQCMHAENNKAPVSTASKVQVREPINSKSIGRWKKFKPYTDTLERYFSEHGIPIK